jgi:Copine
MVVYRSQPVLSSLNPSWDVGQLDLESLCNGDLDRPLRLSVWTHRASSVDTMVGLCETSLRAILNTQRDDRLMAIETEITQHGFPLRQNLEDAKQVGRLLVKMAQVMDLSSNGKDYDFIAKEGSTSTFSCADTIANQPLRIDSAALSSPVASSSTFPPALPSPIAPPATFQDYMKSWKVDLTVAIDFTSSNGDPRIPGTLHDKNPKTWNDYEETIVAIGNALAPYTGEGLLETAVWGFGCKFDGTLKNLFQCGTEAKVSGVYGILQAYQSVFQLDLTMSEPTCFHLVLQQAAAKAHKSQQNGILRYGVLLVITDGLCQDIREPKRLLQNYRTVPLSVIFVGLGRGDMAAMKDLVAPCSAVSRPNATFVDFRQHQQDPGSLGRSALQAVSSQLVGYMQQHNINP